MDPAADISTFLTSRRARITSKQAGLPSYGERRVPGLRREEVASLAAPGSASQQALDLLASWVATNDAVAAAVVAGDADGGG